MRGPEGPSFSWVPAHKTLQEALDLEIPLRWWVGNMWADWFAKLGAHQHAVSQGFCDFLAAELKRAQELLEYVSWAVVRALELNAWHEQSACVKPA
eukprot:3106498-Pyramimonas_sp.AAC.1